MNYQEQQETNAYFAVLQYLKSTRSSSLSKDKAWDEFQATLDKITMDGSLKQAIQIWVMENLENHHPEAIRIRELHEMETLLISSAAHGRLLDATHHGMISLPQSERLLDELLEGGDSQVEFCDVSKMENGILRIWKKNAFRYRDVKIN